MKRRNTRNTWKRLQKLGALVLAGLMVGSTVLAAVLSQVF